MQLKLGLKDEAVANAERALAIARKTEVATTLTNAIDVRIRAADAQGDYKTAATLLQELQTLKD